MRPDHARAKRLLDLTRELEAAARARLTALQADAAAVAQERERLLEALLADHLLHGLFTAASGRRLAALASEEQRFVAAQAACAQDLVELQGRRRVCAKMLDAAAAVARREWEAANSTRSLRGSPGSRLQVRGKAAAASFAGNSE